MSYITSPIVVIKKRLIEWRHWPYRIDTMGLSYAKKSIVAQLIDEKIISDSNAFHEWVEEMEALIERMASSVNDNELRSNWVKVIRIHYTRFTETRESKIALARIPRTTYYRYLKDAHDWLSRELFS